MNDPIPLTTKRFPRTLADAFGPYTSNVIHTEPERPALDVVGYGVLALVAVGLVLLAVLS